MQNKLNLYDIFGYIVPGAFVLSFLYWFYVGFFAFVPLSLNDKYVHIFFTILASYLLGQITNMLGSEIFKKKRDEKNFEYASVKFMTKTDSRYTQEFKKDLDDNFIGYFKVPDSQNIFEEKNRREMFKLCSTLIDQENVQTDANVFYAISGLFRSMYVSVWVGALISAFIASKHLFLFFLSQKIQLPNNPFFVFNELHLIFSLLFILLFIKFKKCFEDRYKKFIELYIDSVYRTFYVWCKRNKNN